MNLRRLLGRGLLRVSASAGTLGRRSLKLTDPEGWPAGYGGTWSGKSVTIDTAMQVATIWSCIRLIAEVTATLPLQVFEKRPDGSRVAADGHGLYGLVHEQPNADQTAAEFWEGMLVWLCLQGNAYAVKSYAGTGAARRLVALSPPLRADQMRVYRDADGVRRYDYSDPTWKFRGWTEDQLFHLRGFGPGGDLGLSPIGYARQTIGSAISADETAAKVFANGLRSAGFLKLAQVLDDEQRAQLAAIMARFMASGELMILEGGMDYSPLTMNPDDAQLLASRAWSVEEMCRWFRVPPVLIGHSAAGQTMWGTGIEQILIGFLTLGLNPYLRKVESAIRRALLAPADRRRYYAEFNVDGLLRGDSKARAAFLSTMTQNGLLTRNEGRALDNRPPLPGGDQLTVQSALLPLDQLGRAVDGGAAEQARNALRNWLSTSALDQSLEAQPPEAPPLENRE